MAFFVPSDPDSGTLNFYNGQTCSAQKPAELTIEHLIEKARNNPDFSEVITADDVEVIVAPKKKASKKKAHKK